jgi:hypothetical protein
MMRKGKGHALVLSHLCRSMWMNEDYIATPDGRMQRLKKMAEMSASRAGGRGGEEKNRSSWASFSQTGAAAWRFLDWGVAGITTDYPDRIAALLRQRGINY